MNEQFILQWFQSLSIKQKFIVIKLLLRLSECNQSLKERANLGVTP